MRRRQWFRIVTLTLSNPFAQRVLNRQPWLSDFRLYMTATCATKIMEKRRSCVMLSVQSCGENRSAPWAFVCDHRSLHRIVATMSTNLMADEPSHCGRTKLTMDTCRQRDGTLSCQTGQSASYNARMRSSSRSMSQKWSRHSSSMTSFPGSMLAKE